MCRQRATATPPPFPACRLDSQEMELRDFSNLKKEFKTLAMTKKDLVYRLATVNGLLEVGKRMFTVLSSVPRLSHAA